MKICKRLTVTCLAALMALCACGCSLFSAPEVPEDTLEWYVDVADFDDGEDTLVDKVIYEKTGVKIKFIYGGTEASSTTLAGMINSDSLPDLVSWERTSTVYREAIETRQLYSYEELFSAYTDIPDFIPEKMKSWNSYVDGKNYGVISHFSASEEPVNFATHVLIARKDMLDEMNMDAIEDFSSMAKFKQTLQSAKAHYAGDKSFIPFFTSDGGQTLHEYLAIPKEDENGDYVDWKSTAAGKQLAKDMNDFYASGLITNESLANSLTEKEAIVSGRVFCMIATWAEVFPLMQDSYKLGQEWVAVGPLRNDNGDDPVLTPWTQAGYLATSVTKNCKNPEAALKLIRFLYSDEGQTLCTYGIEGVTYTVNEDKTYSYTAEYLTAKESKIIDEYGTGWTGVLLYNTDYIEKMRGLSMDESRNSVDRVLSYFSDYTYDSLPFEDIHPISGSLATFSIQAGRAFNWNSLIKNSTQDNVLQNYNSILNDINQNYKYGPVSAEGTIMAYYNAEFHKRKEKLGIQYAWPANIEKYA